jgi:hypothetical protein
MSALNENALTIVASAVVDLQNGDGKTTVYTVPIGKSLIPFCVIIRTPSGSLAGGTDFDIGSGALADTWKQTNDLSAMTAVTDYKVITDLNKHTIEVAGAEFGILPITGAAADVTATMDLIGYLF